MSLQAWERIQTNLAQIFGHQDFRGDQERAIENYLSGRHTLLLMPTGMGKSLCYQLPATLRQGLVLVVSPLIALMQDQVTKARALGLRATAIHSLLSRHEREKAYADLKNGRVSLLFVTPERFRKTEFRDSIRDQKITMLAIDEAHCISQWGHDFRPDYTRIREFIQFLGEPTVLALTATATPEVQADIVQQMGFQSEQIDILRSGLERPNLSVEVLEPYGLEDKVRAFIMLKHTNPGAQIVYFSLVDTLRRFAAELEKMSIPHFIYHGQQSRAQRKSNQQAFLSSSDGLMLATPAFGLGIDKEDIRLIVHAELPGSLESYYQEIGRAGRDGEPAKAALLYDGDDVSIQLDFLKWANPDPGFIHSVWNLLKSQPLRAQQEGFNYLREQLNFYNKRDFRVETALNVLERWEFIEEHDRFYRVTNEPSGSLVDDSIHEQRIQDAREKLQSMVEFAKSETCRMQLIYRYFGLEDAGVCGKCDVCRGQNVS